MSNNISSKNSGRVIDSKGVSKRFKGHIAPCQVDSFITVFDYIAKQLGSNLDAKKMIDISEKAYYDMVNEHKLSVNTSKKILTIYYKVKSYDN